MVIPFGTTREDLKLQLAPSIPWALDVQTGAVDATFDLTNVTLQALTLKAGASSVDVTVGPRIVSGANVTIEGGAASFLLRLPRQLDITLSTSTGLSAVDVDKEFGAASDNTYVPKRWRRRSDGGHQDEESARSTYSCTNPLSVR